MYTSGSPNLARFAVRILLVSLLGAALIAAACAPSAAPTPTSAPATPKPTAPGGTAAEAPRPAATVAPAAQPASSANDAVQQFYSGKTVRIIVGSAPGGGYDTYARAIARHLGRYIPGQPTVIVENMPGAGSLVAANHVYKAADKDGTIIGHIQGGLFLQQVLGLPGVEFDSLKWQVLGAPTSDNTLCIVSKQTGVKSLNEIKKPNGKEVVVAGNAQGSATWDVANRLRVALDLNLRVLEGYDGTAKSRLAMDQGEVDGICGWGYESVRATAWDRVQSGDYVVLTQLTETPIKDLEQVPLALDLAPDEQTKQFIRLGIIVPAKILRPFVVSPEVPEQRADALRQAFMSTMTDAEFVKDAEKAQLELNPLTGEQVQTAIRELLQMPPELKDKLKLINDKKI
ncbi:MAG TPA: tripartite tricarboxylate transporter substrate-binding protein [Chloroflexota bacterium]|nr:tripartite tricarboxylate transporter substrate-binding protein [Chloroflexota bacterium]